MSRRVLLRGTAAGAAVFAAPRAGRVEEYPSRPVRLLVGFPPGGGVDLVARTVGQAMGDALGQPFVVDNRAGAGGNIAAEQATRAPADGYTVMLGNIAQLAINPALYKRLAFDPRRELAPVAQAASLRFASAVHPSVPVATLREFVGLARARPGAFAYGSAGSGSLGHLAVELLRREAGIELTHLPYRGAAPAVLDLVAGRVQFITDAEALLAPQVTAGRLRALATLAPGRSELLPDTPTASEAGFPGLVVQGWQGLVVRTGTPATVAAALSRALHGALEQPAVRRALVAQGIEPAFLDAEAFGSFIAAETARWAEVVRATGASVE